MQDHGLWTLTSLVSMSLFVASLKYRKSGKHETAYALMTVAFLTVVARRVFTLFTGI